jgi:hypothetical protein
MRIRTVAAFAVCLMIVLAAGTAQAQYIPGRGLSDRATGETYRVELGGFFWNPTPNIGISSESLPIVGQTATRIDFVDDLGIEKKRFNQLKVVLRPATKHKFRFEYTPIRYTAGVDEVVTIRRDVIFNGIIFPVALPVQTEMTWKAYRIGYEFDFIYRDRGFLGLLLEAKYTNVEASLQNIISNEFVRARAPIPAIGVIGRVYVAPNISITGEFSGFRLPEGIDEDYRARYYDFDLYGSVNFTDNFGAQVGYRSFDVFYKIDNDEGSLVLKGLYLGGVVRF